MFTLFNRDKVLTSSLSDASTLNNKKTMSDLFKQMKDHPQAIGLSDGSIPHRFNDTAIVGSASDDCIIQSENSPKQCTSEILKLDTSYEQIISNKLTIKSEMKSSKSYTHGLSVSAGSVNNIPSSPTGTANLSILDDISANHSHFFEVLYIGKIRVSHKRVPHTFIDDALPKFKAYGSQKSSLLTKFDTDTTDNVISTSRSNVDAEVKSSENMSDTHQHKMDNDISDISRDKIKRNAGYNKKVKATKTNLTRGQSELVMPLKSDTPATKRRDRSASYGCIPPYVEQNRTMVLLVGKSDLRLISPDRKQVLLYKDFKDIASCAQGIKNAEHFGVICREGFNDGYIGYVFKCQSDHVCDDIVGAISQAFVTCFEQKKKKLGDIFSCDHCPMIWFRKLCSDIEFVNGKKAQSIIFRRIEQLSDDEQNFIWTSYYSSGKINNESVDEQNKFIITLLKENCESRQERHVHDTAENRSEFLNQYLGGSTIFMKAKRSLTNSFDHLLKRKASRDDINITQNIRDLQIKEGPSEGSNSGGEAGPDIGGRSRSNTFSTPSRKTTNVNQITSPMMDIFIKVGNSPKESSTQQGSWRQAILNSIVTPSKEVRDQPEFYSPIRASHLHSRKRNKEEFRELWKTAIRQTILLSRMEKENESLQAKQNENEIKKIKLDYDTIIPADRQLVERWEMIIERDSSKITNKRDPKVLLHAIKNGVPRSKRGDVWNFLAEQHSMNTAPVDTTKFPHFNTPYNMLLKNLTEHQHAIFIDLGRTFPNHKFYKDPLGVGQLSLFNLLKAYSILDPELGYCQGLGFICGVLLLHCEESTAFQLLKHLMFRRKMRTKYLPDMKKFQLQLYQLSRLLKEHLFELYNWLEIHDVSPTLYAAPWILTVFSSQFPLGFVVRVFDMLFLESSEVIFKFAIALLSVHQDELLTKENFEDIMDYLKTSVPNLDSKLMEKVLKLVFTMDISKQLNEFQVEYNVLQEEISTSNYHLDLLKNEKLQRAHLETQLQFAQSSITQLEKTRSNQQTQIANLHSQVQSLELGIQNLGRFVSEVVKQNVYIDVPIDVRRILQQLDDIETQHKVPHFTERKIGKSSSVNSNLGFPLKILEELNERDVNLNIKTKTPYFENTFEQLRQQKPSSSIKNVDELQVHQKAESKRSESEFIHLPPEPSAQEPKSKKHISEHKTSSLEEMHPLSMVGDVNFRFNGTTQLKSIRPIHPRPLNSRNTTTHSIAKNNDLTEEQY